MNQDQKKNISAEMIEELEFEILAVRHVNPKKQIYLCNKLLRVCAAAETVDNKIILARIFANTYIAEVYSETDKSKKAIDIGLKALRGAVKANHIPLIIVQCSLLSQAYLNLGDYNNALRWLYKAHEYTSKESQHFRSLIPVKYNIANLLLITEQFDEAKKMYDSAYQLILDHMTDIPEYQKLLEYHNIYMMDYHYHRKEYNQTLFLTNEMSQDKTYVDDITFRYALVFSELGAHEEAKKWISESLIRVFTIPNLRRRFDFLAKLFYSCISIQDLDLAQIILKGMHNCISVIQIPLKWKEYYEAQLALEKALHPDTSFSDLEALIDHWSQEQNQLVSQNTSDLKSFEFLD